MCPFAPVFMQFYFSGTMSVLKRSLFLVWHEEPAPLKKFSAVESYIFTNIIDRNNYTAKQNLEIAKRLRNFIAKLVEKWKESNRTLKNFETKNKEWLDGPLLLVDPTTNAGRPEKNFKDCTAKTQKQKVSSIVSQTPCNELVVAASSSLYRAGKRNASKVVSILENSEGVAKKFMTCIESDIQLPIKYTAEEALALYMDGDYTKRSYKLMQAGAKARNANIYPSYDILQSAKIECYPNGLNITDYFAEVPLQSLVDNTVARIIKAQEEAFQQIPNDSNDFIMAIYKWGCDGSSGHSTYRQSFFNSVL